MKRTTILMMAALLLAAGACKSNEGEEPAPAEEAAADKAPAADEAADEGEHAEHMKEAKPGDSQTEIPADQTLAGQTEGGNFYVVVTPKPNPIPFQELFELDVEVYESDEKQTLVEGVQIDQARAIMPAHDHGMKTEPKITANDDGSFTVEGMKFHMQGEGEHGLWVVELVLNKDGVIDQTKFDVQCCRE